MDTSPPPPPDRARVILVVDDEEDVRDLIQEILSQAGFSPLTARHGEEALGILAHMGSRVDLVLADVMMPRVDGPTLARRIAKEWPSLPVLFMTGYPDETLAALGMLPKEAPRIEKPFGIRDLVSQIRAALGGPP